LFLSFLLVIVVAVGVVAFFVSRTASGEVERYETRTYDVRIGRVGALLAAYYLERQGWTGVEPVVDQIAQLYNQRLVLVDTQGLVVADSHGMMHVGDRADLEPRDKAIPIMAGQTRFGAVVISPQGPAPPPGGEPAEDASVSDLSSSINRYLLWGGLLGVVAAAVVTFLLSRRILSPEISPGA
jgi:hypothetical protein